MLLVGVWLDPDRPGEWQAVARGPGEPPEIVTGHGSHTALALNDLAKRLRERQGVGGRRERFGIPLTPGK
jgi:hypothetical protein